MLRPCALQETMLARSGSVSVARNRPWTVDVTRAAAQNDLRRVLYPLSNTGLLDKLVGLEGLCTDAGEPEPCPRPAQSPHEPTTNRALTSSCLLFRCHSVAQAQPSSMSERLLGSGSGRLGVVGGRSGGHESVCVCRSYIYPTVHWASWGVRDTRS